MSTILATGSNKDYYWIECKWIDLNHVIANLPDMVIGKTIINTSFYRQTSLTKDDVAAGYRVEKGYVKYPLLQRAQDLLLHPHDELYIFSEDKDIPSPRYVFLNTIGFTLAERKKNIIENIRQPWARLAEIDMQARSDEDKKRFWEQITSIEPETYLGVGGPCGPNQVILCTLRKLAIEMVLLQWAS